MAKAGHNDGFAALCLAAMARQMFDLGRPEDGLELVQLGQYGTRRNATPTLQALLLTPEAPRGGFRRGPSGPVRPPPQRHADVAGAPADPGGVGLRPDGSGAGVPP